MTNRFLPRLVFWFVVLLALAELLSRLYLFISFKGEIVASEILSGFYYPQLNHLSYLREKLENTFRVLILSSSHLASSQFDWYLSSDLENRIGRKVQIVNLSQFAYTSLDSDLLYRHVSHYGFDLVVVYHGLNDLRASNCPASFFKVDYSHYGRYREINFLENHRILNSVTAVPFTVVDIVRRAGLNCIPESVHPRLIQMGWLNYGADVKSAEPFFMHISNICKRAANNNTIVLISGLCTYIPADYTDSLFLSGSLDYAQTDMPLGKYGGVEQILNGLRVHDSVSNAAAETYENAKYVNLCVCIPTGKTYYKDPVHFTSEGLKLFSEVLTDSIAVFIENSESLNR